MFGCLSGIIQFLIFTIFFTFEDRFCMSSNSTSVVDLCCGSWELLWNHLFWMFTKPVQVSEDVEQLLVGLIILWICFLKHTVDLFFWRMYYFWWDALWNFNSLRQKNCMTASEIKCVENVSILLFSLPLLRPICANQHSAVFYCTVSLFVIVFLEQRFKAMYIYGMDPTPLLANVYSSGFSEHGSSHLLTDGNTKSNCLDSVYHSRRSNVTSILNQKHLEEHTLGRSSMKWGKIINNKATFSSLLFTWISKRNTNVYVHNANKRSSAEGTCRCDVPLHFGLVLNQNSNWYSKSYEPNINAVSWLEAAIWPF